MPRGDRGGKSRGSGVRCVAANCGNTHADGFSLHKFPKQAQLRRRWAAFVKIKRAKWDGPTEYSALCSSHFKPDCYPFSQRFQMEQMGTKPKKMTLNDDAVPTIHSVPETNSEPQVQNEPNTTTPQARNKMHRLEMLSPTEASTSQASPPKKFRRAYLKRESVRILESFGKSSNEEESCAVDDDDDDLAVPMAMDNEQNEEADEFEINASTRTNYESVGCQINIRPKKRSRYCQTSTKETRTHPIISKESVSVGCQTDESEIRKHIRANKRDAFVQVRPAYLEKERDTSTSDEVMSSPLREDNDNNYDPDYEPESPDSCHIDDEELRNRPEAVHEMNLYLVYEVQLLELFKNCIKCNSLTTAEIRYTNGTLLKIDQSCPACDYERSWYSQPFVGGKPAGNLAVSAGILFSGSIPAKVLRLFQFMKLPCISMSTFLKHQTFYLFPAVAHVWHNYQTDYVNDVRSNGRGVVLGGDGRADTPGHSAKYGSYTMLDLEEGTVVDVQLVQSNEVKSSCHMEKEGLMRSVFFFNSKDINISALVTDRHLQINKWVRENMTDTIHYFDVWHVAKGLKKKLLALSKEKECSELQPWIKSITNHLYWTAASTQEENGDLMKAKWSSLANHIINKHSGHSDQFPVCSHGNLEGEERHKKWLKPGTKVYEKLHDLIMSKQMIRDVPRLSPGQQTSCLEGFHSVINQFAPKMFGFSFHGMYARLWLSALHFNENCQRDQAVTKEGVPRYRIVYPKFKKGGYTVRKVPVNCTYDYVDSLMRTVYGLAAVQSMNEDAIHLLIDVPPPLCNDFDRPDKQEAIRAQQSRFNLQNAGNQCRSDHHQEMCS